jgi:hypothetical protein
LAFRDVAAQPRQAGDETLALRATDAQHDDRDRVGRVLRSSDRYRAAGHHEIDLHLDELSNKAGVSVLATL